MAALGRGTDFGVPFAQLQIIMVSWWEEMGQLRMRGSDEQYLQGAVYYTRGQGEAVSLMNLVWE